MKKFSKVAKLEIKCFICVLFNSFKSLPAACIVCTEQMKKKKMQSYALKSLHFSFKQDTVTENDK